MTQIELLKNDLLKVEAAIENHIANGDTTNLDILRIKKVMLEETVSELLGECV